MSKILGMETLDVRLLVRSLIFIIIGSIIAASGINAFLVPHKFLSSGISGVSQLLSYLTPISVGVYVLLLNIPIFIMGWFWVGRVFVVGSAIGMLTFSISLMATGWMAEMGWAPEPLLSAIIGGVLSGGGTGLVFRANSSHGGVDIIAAAVKKRWSLTIGTVVFLFNAIVVVTLGIIFGLHAALYTIIVHACSSMALDRVIIGLDTSRAIFVITSEPQKIADLILKKLNRGVTFLEGEGAYLRRKQRVIYTVVTLSQLARVKHYVATIDPYAFVTVAEVSEVHGKGFKAVPI